MSDMRYMASLMLVFMGSMDCLTTVIGTVYFGTQELNPIVASLVNTNLTAFVFVKLTITLIVGLVFIWAEKSSISNRHDS